LFPNFQGKPTPTVTWYRDGVAIVAETNFLSNGRHLRSEISLGPLNREDLNTILTCKSHNHPRGSAIESTVQLDMNCKQQHFFMVLSANQFFFSLVAPLNIRLLGAHQALSANRRYDLLCQSAGSRPPAVITWFRDGVRLDKTTETVSIDIISV
jgi:immunoglobulin superfamily member 9B